MVDGEGGGLWPILIPLSIRARMLGIRLVAPGEGVLLATTAVHGRGIAETLHVVAIDGAGRIVAVRRLPPGTRWRRTDALWMLEIPASSELPPVGGTVRLLVSRHD